MLFLVGPAPRTVARPRRRRLRIVKSHRSRVQANVFVGGPVTEAEEGTTSRLHALLARLGFSHHPTSRSSSPDGVGTLAAHALRILAPPVLSEREERALACADQLAHDTTRALAIVEQAHLYLALLGCSWAQNAILSRRDRNLALLVAIGFASLAGENARVALGIEHRLVLLARDRSLDAELRALCETVGSARLERSELRAKLEAALKKLASVPSRESKSDSSPKTKNRGVARACDVRRGSSRGAS